MNEKFKILTEIIKNRRAVYPQFYEKGQISHELLEQVLDLARWAPTHKKTEPWRFKIFKNEELEELSKFLEKDYQDQTSQEAFNELKMKKAGEKALQSTVVIAICIERSPESIIPAWEETAAVACSVQNMWLASSSLGIGSYWSSPGAVKRLPAYFKFKEEIECLGLFYMGWMKKDLQLNSERKSLKEILI